MKLKPRVLCIALSIICLFHLTLPAFAADRSSSYIKWVDFTVPAELLRFAAQKDIETVSAERHIDWIELLSAAASECGGNFRTVKTKALSALCEQYLRGDDFDSITTNKKLYAYYLEAYTAVLGGMLGAYRKYTKNQDGSTEVRLEYGVLAFSPIAKGYYYNHFDDFGSVRNYGYKRPHLGHDLMGSVGTPVIAVEAGYVEACGWNQYGGWRVGIRSFDGKRYYYYAHLRKDHPYNDVYEGKTVAAGEVIGYLGMTGYSAKENVNNISTPHLHYGLQLIFDKSQKDGVNQIWIDLYELTKFLDGQKASVRKQNDGEYEAESWIEPLDFWD